METPTQCCLGSHGVCELCSTYQLGQHQPDAGSFNNTDLNTTNTDGESGESTPRTMFCSQKQKLVRTKLFSCGPKCIPHLGKKLKKKKLRLVQYLHVSAAFKMPGYKQGGKYIQHEPYACIQKYCKRIIHALQKMKKC